MEWIFLFIGGIVLFNLLKGVFSRRKVTYTDVDGNQKTEFLKRRQPRQILQFEKPEIELTAEVENILNKFENTSENIFLTGKAGTGKSTLLRYFRATTKKNYAVVAPTGIAALNVQGQTIHSFFGFGIDITPERVKFVSAEKLFMFRKLETLIIDEISMVRADLLDCINVSLQKNRRNNFPFGGVQVIAIGDPYQLPPVVKTSEKKYFYTVYKSPHFFNAKCYAAARFKTLELTKIYRQSDGVFINILNYIRSGEVTQEVIDLLNSKTEHNVPQKESIKLVTTNALAKVINNSEMNMLPGESRLYKGYIAGNFDEHLLPAEMELNLKVGARVMLLNNDRNQRWVNGDSASIIELGQNFVKVRFDDNTFDEIELHEWDNINFVFDEEQGRIVPEIVGKYVQLPIKLAWSITIHKSQGKTYENVHIDFGTGTFAPGQAYVALSRCTSLEGLSFATPMQMGDVITDEDVKIFMGTFQVKLQVEQKVTVPNSNILLNSSTVSQSDLNKLYSFISSPEKYATGTKKAMEKVRDARRNFNLIKNTLDQKVQEDFYEALNKYNNKLKSLQN